MTLSHNRLGKGFHIVSRKGHGASGKPEHVKIHRMRRPYVSRKDACYPKALYATSARKAMPYVHLVHTSAIHSFSFRDEAAERDAASSPTLPLLNVNLFLSADEGAIEFVSRSEASKKFDLPTAAIVTATAR